MLTNKFVDEAFLVKKDNVKVESVDSDGRKKISIFGEHQASNIVNKNLRVYSEELWNELLERKDFREAEKSNRILGFLGHPDFSKSTSLDYTKFSHFTKNIYRENNIIYATDYPTSSPMGRLLTNYMIDDNIQFGISSRGYGESKPMFDNKLGREIEIMKPGFVLEGWDFVLDPSCYIAFPKVKLESRVYLENWNPVLNIFKETVREQLDTEDSEKYIDTYKWFSGQLKKYPNIPAVKDYVFSSLDSIIIDLDKKKTKSESTKFFYDKNLGVKDSDIESLSAENDKLKSLLRKYEYKVEELVGEINSYRIEADDNQLNPQLGVDTLRISKDDLEKPKEEIKTKYSGIKVSDVKKMTLRDLKDLGRIFAILPREKKQVFVSSVFSDQETEIEDSLGELISKKENTYIRKKKVKEDKKLFNSLRQMLLFSDNDTPTVVEKSKNKVVKKESNDIIIPDREVLLSVKKIRNPNNYVGNEAYSEYLESMELTDVESPFPIGCYMTVVKEYNHPASGVRLNRNEYGIYMGYFKGNWDYKLKDIAVIKLEYHLFGAQAFKYITMEMKDLYNHFIQYKGDNNEMRDSSLPFSGYVDVQKDSLRKSESSFIERFQATLEEGLVSKQPLIVG